MGGGDGGFRHLRGCLSNGNEAQCYCLQGGGGGGTRRKSYDKEIQIFSLSRCLTRRNKKRGGVTKVGVGNLPRIVMALKEYLQTVLFYRTSCGVVLSFDIHFVDNNRKLLDIWVSLLFSSAAFPRPPKEMQFYRRES